MTPLRTKDRVFLLTAVPAAAVAAYIWLWRIDAARRADGLETRSAALVTVEGFDGEMALAGRQLASATRELEEEKSKIPPATNVKGDPSATAAERESEVLAVFRSAGLWAVRSEEAEGGPSGQVLQAAGSRPDPRCRRYLLEGSYPAVKRALDLFVAKEMAVVPERLEMAGNGAVRWMMEVWE